MSSHLCWRFLHWLLWLSKKSPPAVLLLSCCGLSLHQATEGRFLKVVVSKGFWWFLWLLTMFLVINWSADKVLELLVGFNFPLTFSWALQFWLWLSVAVGFAASSPPCHSVVVCRACCCLQQQWLLAARLRLPSNQALLAGSFPALCLWQPLQSSLKLGILLGCGFDINLLFQTLAASVFVWNWYPSIFYLFFFVRLQCSSVSSVV